MTNKRTSLLLIFLLVFIYSCNKDENIAPTCSIGIIQNNMEILKGTSIMFPVYAVDEDGSISSVVVSIGGEAYDTANIAPYEFGWSTQNSDAGTYAIAAVATNNEGETASSVINVNVITNIDPVTPCPEAINISYGGQIYNTVKIGSQCWLKENLNVDTENSVDYNDDPGNGDFYGQLYNWDEAMAVCPPGWRLPTFDDWCTLAQHTDASIICTQDNEIGTDAAFKLKSNGGWLNGQSGSDQFGFRALPGGVKSEADGYAKIGEQAAFWSSATGADGFASLWAMTTTTTRISNAKAAKTERYSVRCLKEQ